MLLYCPPARPPPSPIAPRPAPQQTSGAGDGAGAVVFYDTEAGTSGGDGHGDAHDADDWKARGNVPVSPQEKGYATQVDSTQITERVQALAEATKAWVPDDIARKQSRRESM